MFLASKGCAFSLLAVCLCQFKNKHLSELQWWFQNIEKADYLLCTPNAKILHNPVHAVTQGLGFYESWALKKQEAEGLKLN